MILRWLWLALFIAALWFVRRVLLSMRDEHERVGPGRRGGGPMTPAEPLVRDRVCDTFVPRSRAIATSDAQGEHFFCSTACRDRYLASRSSETA